MQFRGTLGRLGVAALAVAILAGGSVYASSTAHAQSPSSVPAARFYGIAKGPAGTLPSNLTITANVGPLVCTGTQSIPQSQTNSGVDNGGNYAIDIQSVPGCTTPGASIKFTAGGLTAKETGTIPDLPGTAVHLNLNFQLPATPTAAPAPPPAPPAATQAPAPRPATATAAAPVAQRPVTQAAAPKGPVAAGAPRLPSTGTGGLLDQQSSNSGLTAGMLALIVLAALGVSASGLVAYRRSR